MVNDSGTLIHRGILFLRTGIGLAFIIFHGMPKLIGGPERWTGVGSALKNFGIDFYHQYWGLAAALTETAGGLLLILGLFFRPAAALMLVVMMVAVSQFIVKGEPFLRIAHPAEIGIVLIALIITGPGMYSFDKYFRRRKTSVH